MAAAIPDLADQGRQARLRARRLRLARDQRGAGHERGTEMGGQGHGHRPSGGRRGKKNTAAAIPDKANLGAARIPRTDDAARDFRAERVGGTRDRAFMPR